MLIWELTITIAWLQLAKNWLVISILETIDAMKLRKEYMLACRINKRRGWLRMQGILFEPRST